jgi:hypothetical protein
MSARTRGLLVGAAAGLVVGCYLAATWWFRARGWAGSRDEALEGRVLLAYLVAMPFSMAVGWLTEVGRYPYSWLRFIVAAPTLAGAVWGGLVGALVAVGRAKRSHSRPTTH